MLDGEAQACLKKDMGCWWSVKTDDIKFSALDPMGLGCEGQSVWNVTAAWTSDFFLFYGEAIGEAAFVENQGEFVGLIIL